MFSHVMVGVNDLEVSKKFYDALLGTLGIGPGVANNNRYFYRSATGSFGITTPINGEPASFANGGTIGFNMQSPEQADAFHAAGIANGGATCEDPPGLCTGPRRQQNLCAAPPTEGLITDPCHRIGWARSRPATW
jgi:catechol 2,3-dioxygenase-like lactoylglutathione lyase family enzyme